jgi:tetratricopeptide (TPR) repeat protein
MRFEAAWRAGQTPRLEAFLGEADEADGPERAALLHELLRVELDYRLARGERPNAGDYEKRFPGIGELIRHEIGKRWPAPPRSPLAASNGVAAPAVAETTSAPLPGPEATPAGTALRNTSCHERGAGSAVRLRDPDVSAGEPLAWPDTPAASGLPSAGLVGRYQLLGKLGCGGMGEVLRGRDPTLGRDLAIKVLLERYAGQPEVVQRFREEAQIGGQLQHPGVVPVYELGGAEDGQLYFTMKLVKGVTLAQLLKERPTPAHERARFLKVFEQVCQTVAYAHARGVIHRDLKPHNVMVGSFGEVQLMDWGLAKLLPADEAGDERTASASRDASASAPSVIQVARPEGASDTQDGQVLGTPAYMPPEQALGEVDRLDERCDVFSLGALLCEILTGQPPYAGEDPAAVLRRARRADLANALARLDGCGADPELIDLARRCLAAEPAERPGHAGEVAKAVEAYLAGVEERARRAELERAAAEIRAEQARTTARAERRARRLTVGLTAAVLVLLGAGGSGAWWFQQQRAAALARQQETDTKVRAILERAGPLLEEAWQTGDTARLAECQALADKAREMAHGGNASADLQRQTEDLHAQVQQKVAQDRKNQALRTALLDVIQPRETQTYQQDTSGQMVVIAGIPVEEQYARAFGRWGLDIDKESLEAIVARCEAQPRPVVDEMVAGLEAWLLERRRQKQAEARWRKLLAVADRLDRDNQRRELRQLRLGSLGPPERQRLRELAGKLDPSREPVLGLVMLAGTLRAAGEDRRAEEVLRSAVAARPGAVALLNALGKLLEEQRPPRLGEAIECYRAARAVRADLGIALGNALRKAKRAGEAVAVLKALRRGQPHNPAIIFCLGNALRDQKKYAEAEAAYRKAIALRPDFTVAYNNLGGALHEQKKYAEAEAACRKAIELRPDFPEAYGNLGNALARQKKYAEAEATLRKTIELRPDLPEAYYNLGVALKQQGKLGEAVAAYRKAIALRPDFPEAHNNLGNALYGQEKYAEAEAAWRKAIALRPNDHEAYCNLGNALHQQKKYGEAVTAYCKAIELLPDFPEAYTNLSNALRDLKKYVEAEIACRKAIALRPDYPEAYNGLGLTLQHQKKYAEAEAAYRKAIELRPDYPLAYNNLGTALGHQQKYAEAEAAYRKAIALQPDFPEAYNNLGTALNNQKMYAEAEAACRKAVALRPENPEAYTNLGITLAYQKQYEEAVAAYRKAITLKPDYSEAYYNLGNALRDQKKDAEAVAAYRKALALRPDYPEACNNLGNALKQQGKLGEAVAAYRKADQLLPNHPIIRNNLRQAEHLLELDRKLPALLDGKAPFKSPQEQIDLADFLVTYKKSHWRAAVHLYRDAFVAEPKLAEQHRYNAA